MTLLVLAIAVPMRLWVEIPFARLRRRLHQRAARGHRLDSGVSLTPGPSHVRMPDAQHSIGSAGAVYRGPRVLSRHGSSWRLS